MKKIILNGVLSLCLLGVSLPLNTVSADEASHLKMAAELVSAMKMADQLKGNLPMVQNQLLMTLARKYPEANDKTIEEIRTLTDAFIMKMMASAAPRLAQTITKNFSEKELVDVLAFFNSSSGKAFVSKQPGMSNAMMQWTNQSMMEAVADIDKKVQKMMAAEK